MHTQVSPATTVTSEATRNAGITAARSDTTMFLTGLWTGVAVFLIGLGGLLSVVFGISLGTTV